MAEVALITSVVKGVVDGLLSLANDQIKDQIKLVWGFKKDLKKLCNRLETIQALVADAENQKITSAPMMVWLKRIKAATCEAENVLDELTYEALRRKIEVQNKMTSKVRDLFTLSDPLSFRFKMAKKVNNINKLLDEIREGANDVGLKPAEQLSFKPIVEPREFETPGHFVVETEVVGRDGDVSRVVKMLLGSNVECDLHVIAIVGMPGLGKTTLAQVVYNKVEVLENFCDKSATSDKRMWICVSDNFQVDRLLNEMVQSLTGKKPDIQNRQGVLKILGEKLKGQKYLLVLDDVWNTNLLSWENLRSSLIGIGGSKDSKILITTRNREVVLTMKIPSTYIHELMQLSKDDSWTMFWKRALAHREPSETQTLEDIGRRMVEKCKGLPLAINALGGLLYSKQDEQEWKSIEKSELLSSPESKDGILPVLRLSFDHLPSPSLKQSFAYCSIFPKDYVFIKDDLIQLWMGLGYLQPSLESKMEMEEIGNEYFNTLLLNSLFQEVKFDEYNNITRCKMHDLVHDLARHVSQGSCLVLEGSEVKNNHDVQHLSLYLSKEEQLDISKESATKLRTIFLGGHLPQNTKDFKCIRALCLESHGVEKEPSPEKLPSSIAKSIHLRFLDLTMSSIVKVPNSITRLYNLETLKLPRSLEELPKDFHNLVSLRHFYLEDSEENRKLMPMKIGQLTSLQTLPFFVVGKDSGHRIEELGNLSKLRGRLHVYNLQHVKDREEAEKANMLGKSNIQELRFCWDGDFGESDNNHEEVLDGLQPHRNVKGVILVNFGGKRLAPWMSRGSCFLQNLVKIKLKDCKLCEQVPGFGHLPHLAILTMNRLLNLKRIGPEFYGLDAETVDNCSRSGPARVFPALRKFEVLDLPQLEEWLDVSSLPAVAKSTMEFFPRLQLLEISKCPTLKTIPALFYGSTSLQRMHISWCDELTCLPKGLLQPTLVELALCGCSELMTLNPEELRSLTSLKRMGIVACPKLGSSWEEGLVCTTDLQLLTIGLFGKEFGYFPWPSTSAASPPWSHFNSLGYLILWGWPEVKSLPDQIEHLTALKGLEILGFSGLESLPEWFCNLSTLQKLKIIRCPHLTKKCEKESGEDWHKIAHIPDIYINDSCSHPNPNASNLLTFFYGKPA